MKVKAKVKAKAEAKAEVEAEVAEAEVDAAPAEEVVAPCQNCPACPKLPLHAQNLPSPALPKTATVPNPPPPT